jgi:type IV secretion system protein VirD4
MLLKFKDLDKPIKTRIIAISIIIILDLILLPWIIQFPFFFFQDIKTAPQAWLQFGIFNSIKAMLLDFKLRNIFLVLQLGVGASILAIAWNVNNLKRKNKISDGVGGPEAGGDGEHGTSRWMTAKEKEKASKIWHTTEELKAGGVVFGMEKTKEGEKIYLDDQDTNNMIIGASRSGKSRKIYLPSIWEIAKAQESMIIGDPKGELYISSKEYLEKEGYTIIALNIREPLKGNQWNMLDLINKAVDEGNVSKAAELAWDMASTITKQTPGTSSEPIWQNGEQSTIAALILLTVLESEFKFQRHMTTAYYLLAEYGQALDDGTIPLNEYMRSLSVKHPAKSAFATASIAPAKTRASFFTSALADLRLFADPNIGDMCSKQDHILENIGIEKTAVFLIIPDEKSTRNVLATLYIDQVYQSLVDLANKNGGRIPRRVQLLLDEFGNLPPIPDFDKKITVCLGRGMRFTLALQDITQLKKLYDKNAQTISGNCQNKIYISTADYETAKLFSDYMGKYTIETENLNSTIQSKGHSIGKGVGTTGRPLLMPEEVLRWSTKESLLIRAGHFPARYKLPDLAEYKANEELGLLKHPDIEVSKELNKELIMKRWEEVIARPLEEVQIWLPEFDFDAEEESQVMNDDEQVAKMIAATSEMLMKSPVAAQHVQSIQQPIEALISEIPIKDIDLDSILKSNTDNNAEPDSEEDEDFL